MREHGGAGGAFHELLKQALASSKGSFIMFGMRALNVESCFNLYGFARRR